MHIQEKDKAYIAGTYGRFPVTLVKGKGSEVFDENGKRYIDLGTGIAVNSFGVADDAWKEAVINQLDKIQHASNLYYTEPQVQLAEALVGATGMKKVFFGNSGAEANECAIKVARKYGTDKYGEGHHRIITLKNSFHGRTITTLAATGQDVFHTSFTPFTEGFSYAVANDIDDMKAKFQEADDVCGVLMELVQGEGGVMALDKEYVQEVAKLCREKDALLMIDEVQTGNGRTGSIYAFMQYDITPDVVTTAKGLGGGLPIGACIIGEKAENVLTPSSHGSTFGGNPICAAGAVHVFSRLTPELLEGVKEREALIRSTLQAAPGVKEISGMGLMLGITPTEKSAKEIVNEALSKGVLVLTAKEKVRLLPALNIPMEQLTEALSVLKEIFA